MAKINDSVHGGPASQNGGGNHSWDVMPHVGLTLPNMVARDNQGL